MPTAKKKVSAKKTTHSVRETKKVTPVKSFATKKSTTNNTASSTTYLKNPRLWVGVGVVVLLVLLYVFRGLFVAAVVNGQPISRLSVVSQLEKQNGKQAMSDLIVQTLVMQEAQKRHVTVSQSDINAQIAKIENQLKTQGTTLDAALAARGLSRSDLVQQLTLQAMVDKMVGTSVKVSDADVANYINTNKDSLPQNLSDDQLKQQVKSQLEQQALQQKTQTFVADLQKKANIQYWVNY